MLTVDFDRLHLRDGDRILDLGCGEGRHVISAYTLKNIASIGVDLSVKDLQTARNRFQAEFEEKGNSRKSLALIAADGLSLPFADRSFDKIICAEVLEHVPDHVAVIREINRVLKPGGFFVASVPRFYPEWICWKLSRAYHQEAGGHIKIFVASRLQREIEKQGFVFYDRHWAHALHVPYWWLQCLFWSTRESSRLIKAYHQFLVWDLFRKPRLTQTMDRLLNPVLGKSIVLYFKKD